MRRRKGESMSVRANERGQERKRDRTIDRATSGRCKEGEEDEEK